MKNSIESQNNKWLIIFLIYADFTTNEKLPLIEKMKSLINNVLGDIITTPINNDHTRMFVVFNSIKYIQIDLENKIEDQTALFIIKNASDGSGNYIHNCGLINNKEHYSNQSGKEALQRPEQLKSIFEKIHVKSDEEILLITVDHGSAFGIFRKKDLPDLSISSIQKEIDKNTYQYPFIKLFWDRIKKADESNFLKRINSNDTFTSIQLGQDRFKIDNYQANIKALNFHINNKSEYFYDKLAGKIIFTRKDNLIDESILNEINTEPIVPEILKNSELDECLKSWLGDKKVSILLMNNCWMMNLHTMYTFKDSVQYLVAPQGSIDIPGYNIKDILNKIYEAGGAGIGAKELAIACVETIDNAYSHAKALILDRSEPDVIEYFKIFAVDLSIKSGSISMLEHQINLLKKFVELLVEELKTNEQKKIELKHLLKYIRTVCFDFSGKSTMMVDIVNWVRSLKSANSLFTGKNLILLTKFDDPIYQFLDITFVERNPLLLTSSSGKKIYEDPALGNSDLAKIVFPPTGYSFFFPTGNFNELELKDNVKSDKLLNEFPIWKDLLILLDPAISNIFEDENA